MAAAAAAMATLIIEPEMRSRMMASFCLVCQHDTWASDLALDLRYEGQEPARIVVHDFPQDLVARARLLHLGYEHGQRLGVAQLMIVALQRGRIREIGRKHEMVGVTCVDQRHDHWHHEIVVWAALAIEADERPAPADRAMHLRIRVNQVSEVTDDDALRIDTRVLKD